MCNERIWPEPEFINNSPLRRNIPNPMLNLESTQNLELEHSFDRIMGYRIANRGHKLICSEPEFINKSPFRRISSDPRQNSKSTENLGSYDIFLD